MIYSKPKTFLGFQSALRRYVVQSNPWNWRPQRYSWTTYCNVRNSTYTQTRNAVLVNSLFLQGIGKQLQTCNLFRSKSKTHVWVPWHVKQTSDRFLKVASRIWFKLVHLAPNGLSHTSSSKTGCSDPKFDLSPVPFSVCNCLPYATVTAFLRRAVASWGCDIPLFAFTAGARGCVDAMVSNSSILRKGYGYPQHFTTLVAAKCGCPAPGYSILILQIPWFIII